MKKKPVVCLIDGDDRVRQGWEHSLGSEAELLHYPDHLAFLGASGRAAPAADDLACVVVGRYFPHLSLDLLTSDAPERLREKGCRPIFLNWQGYITKEEVGSRFDGKLFHRFGVKWQTLRLRVQKYTQCLRIVPPQAEARVPPPPPKRVGRPASRSVRCRELLRDMARHASGTHRERIEFLMRHDEASGVKLLEAIYSRLLTDRNRPEGCPSQYINSSPIIAKRILKDTLFG